MESAIPAHLRTERTRSLRVPEDYVPPIPAVVSRFSPRVTQVVMAYLGVQYRGGGPPVSMAERDATLAALGGPDHCDRAIQTEPGGTTDLVRIAYWKNPATFDDWFGAHRDMWMAAGDREHIGRWVEVIRPVVHRYETIFSAPNRPQGVAMIGDGWSGQIQEHAYWGSMRDRVPQSQTDALPGGGEPKMHRDGDRVRVHPGTGLCLIRSGQDWSETTGADREQYLGKVAPTLRAGMDFLRDEGRAIGCYANRHLTVLCDDEPTEHTFGMSWWRSLDALERWAESHPTHLAIFGAATDYYATLGPKANLRLYHEVSVVEPDEQYFEYAGCHHTTGLLGALAGVAS